MRRREFIALVGSFAATRPLAAGAQQPEGMRRIGVLIGYPESDSEARLDLAAFVQELQKLGWADRRNLRTDTRWASPADAVAMKRSAQELVALQPNVILASSTLGHDCAAATNTNHPHRFCGRRRSRSAAASSRASGDRAATSPVSTFRRRRKLASEWNYSKRLRRVSPGSQSCSTRKWRPLPNIG